MSIIVDDGRDCARSSDVLAAFALIVLSSERTSTVGEAEFFGRNLCEGLFRSPEPRKQFAAERTETRTTQQWQVLRSAVAGTAHDHVRF
jgi:hypothetical protein